MPPKDKNAKKAGQTNEDLTIQSVFDNANFLDLWHDKLFLGAEFLTWLWIVLERDNHVLTLNSGEKIEAYFEKSLRLLSGQGPNKRSIAITTPEDPAASDWDEAYTALENHKKVMTGSLRIKTVDKEWSFTLPHDTLIPQSLKIGTIKDPEEEDELGQAGRFLDRVGLIFDLINILKNLFEAFLTLRLSEAWETEELPKLKEFLNSRK
ncbi:MAG: hypothetical protein LBF22_05005 [Deltaproteobacteria bacterium]|nr:hypothetical protein [Deltaproteobacteria bacterium]